MKNNLNFKKKLTVAAVIASMGLCVPVFADNTTSNIVGKIESSNLSGITATAKNPKTGYKRTIDIDSSGSYRFSKLPSGTYEVTIQQNGNVVAKDTFTVSLGSNTSADFVLESNDSNVVQIVGSRLSSVDVTSLDSGLTISKSQLESMPIAQNISAVTLLAPGVVAGDTKFSGSGVGFTSFGGSSISENSCYINGLEVTNTRQGLGCGTVPFEFYNEFQVKTGGYSAAFGRATGGVINATTKSGSNDWEFVAKVAFEPSSLQMEGSTSRGLGGSGDIFHSTELYENSLTEFTFSAAGPIIEDTLYIYALMNPRDSERHYLTGNGQTAGDDEYRVRNSSGGDNLFWGTKIDWDINENHRLSYFGYSNDNTGEEQVYGIDTATGKPGALIDGSLRQRGGKADSITYTGHITDDLTLSLMSGTIETQYTTNVLNVDCPSVTDSSSGGLEINPCGSGGRLGSNFDENDQTRLDIEYVLGDHVITAGYDYQKRTSTNRIDKMAGDHAWTYRTLGANGDLSTRGINYTNTSGAAQEYVSDRIFIGGGTFYSDLTAYFVEDQWQVTDDLLISVGLRVDEFDAFAVGGGLLTTFKTDIAPRLGFSWDINGNGDSKLYATWGHYYLPMANNTIYRVGSGISDSTAYYTYTGIDATTSAPTGLAPITGNAATSLSTSSVSVAPANEVFQAEEADPFSKEEIIIGYETTLNEDYSLAIRGTYRTILTALDDYCGKYSFPHCVMLNPGEDSTWFRDGLYWNGSGWDPAPAGQTTDGFADPGSRRTHTVAEIGLPKAKNDYIALQSSLNYNSEKFRYTLIYTLARSYGNFEGAVKSDIGQADPGLTQDWDFAALMDGANGYQPNDRRHAFKLFGSYDYTEDLSFGFNANLSSGRPVSILGQGHPSDDPNLFGGWGDFFYINHGCKDGSTVCPDKDDQIFSRHPRGSVGRTPWTFKLDLSTSYKFEFSGVDMRATVDVFNVLNSQGVTSQNEHYETAPNEVNPWHGAAYSWQNPRYVRLGLEARF